MYRNIFFVLFTFPFIWFYCLVYVYIFNVSRNFMSRIESLILPFKQHYYFDRVISFNNPIQMVPVEMVGNIQTFTRCVWFAFSKFNFNKLLSNSLSLFILLRMSVFHDVCVLQKMLSLISWHSGHFIPTHSTINHIQNYNFNRHSQWQHHTFCYRVEQKVSSVALTNKQPLRIENCLIESTFYEHHPFFVVVVVGI